MSAHTVDIGYVNRHVFGRPGTYRVKGEVDPFSSAPVRVLVKAPEGADAAAKAYLDKTPLYRYFTNQSARFYMGMEEHEDPEASWKLADFIPRFPRSRYSAWARLGLLLVKKNQIEAPEDQGGVQKEMERLAPTLPAPVNAWRWYEAAPIARMRDDTATMTANLDRALATGADATP